MPLLFKIYDLLPCSWQQSAFSGNRCTSQFLIPQVRVPSHSSSLSQSPSWIPHLFWIVQQLQELPLALQVSWPLQLVASSHATIKDEKSKWLVLFISEFSLRQVFSDQRNWRTQKRSNFAKLQFLKGKIYSHTQKKKILALCKLASFAGKRRFYRIEWKFTHKNWT